MWCQRVGTIAGAAIGRAQIGKNDFGPAVAFNHCFVGGVGFGVADGVATGVWVTDVVDTL